MTPKEVRQLWVKALRSGEYEQGKNCLKTADGKYCCLGVLTDLALKNDVIDSFEGNLVLAVAVMDWVGLRNRNALIENDVEKSLTNLNDKTDVGFGGIADVIESEPEGLFVPFS